jgi:hypothetical protein
MWRFLLTVSVLAGQGFERDLQPIFRKHCYGCHAATVKMGSLDIETHEGVMRGGNQGPIVMPGKASESRLYLTLTGAMEPFMPMGGKRLEQAELDLVKRWIDAGARPDPGGLVWKGSVIAMGWGGEIWVLHEKGKLMRKISAHVGTVRGVWLSEDGRMVGASGNGVERAYEAMTGTEVKVKGMEFQTGLTALSPDKRRRAVLQEDGSVRFYEHE